MIKEKEKGKREEKGKKIELNEEFVTIPPH